MSDPIGEALLILRKMKGTIGQVGRCSVEEASDARRFLNTSVEKIEKLLVQQPHHRPPKTSTLPAEIKPSWRGANAAYEWALKAIPPKFHTFKAIHRAATTNAKAPKVRLPDDPATFAQYVRAYRSAMNLPLHRAVRRG